MAKKKSSTPRPVAVPPPMPEPQPFRIMMGDRADETNPGIVEEIDPGQRAAFEVAVDRLNEYPAETARRLIGLALFVTGLDPASEDEAKDALRKILGNDEDVPELLGRLLDLESRFQDITVARAAEDRAAFLKARQAELARMIGESRAVGA